MRPVSTDSDGPAPPENLSYPCPLLGSLPATEMSLLQSLGPVKTWLGQELEKCGIDAMIYTRYVLSLLLHDSYDYDLQDQVKSLYLKSDLFQFEASKKFNFSCLFNAGLRAVIDLVYVDIGRRTTSSWAGRRELERSGARARKKVELT